MAKDGKAEVQLPDETLLINFSKLALQDPLTFPAASSACRKFQAVASLHASLWRSAFYSLSSASQSFGARSESIAESGRAVWRL